MRNAFTFSLVIAIIAIMSAAGCGDNAPIEGSAVPMRGATDTNAGGAFGDIVFGADSVGTAPDTGAQDVDPDTAAQPDSAQPDTSLVDTGVVDTGLADTTDDDADPVIPDGSGTPDDALTTPDVAEDGLVGDATSDAVEDGGGNDPNSCVGRCGKYDGKAKCQCDSYCSSAGDCCVDLAKVCGCVGKDCCKSDLDCNDGLACTTETCGSKGACEVTFTAGYCAIDGKCIKSGTAGPSACAVCDPKKDTAKWSAKAAGASCDDKQICTTGDVCDAKGLCSGKVKAGCCTGDAGCVSEDSCKIGTCNKAAGTCSFSDKTGCCSSGACCDTKLQKIKAKGSPCSTSPVKAEFRCEGSAVQKREALAGCDGVGATSCSAQAATLVWGSWKTIQSCAKGQACKLTSADKAPVCENTGTGCGKAADCNDNNPCTTDSCSAGKCSNQTKVGCCVFASDCDDGNGCTTDTCANNTCKNAAKVCTAPSSCESGACDVKTGKCTASVSPKSCKIDGACYAAGAKHSKDGCLVCEPSKSQTSWSLTGVCSCTKGACCDVKAGRIKEKAAQCDDDVQASEYSCSTTGTSVLVRNARRGCTGKSNTCSVSASNWSWSKWTPSLVCAKGTVCEVKDKTIAGKCVTGTVGASCNPSATNACCTSAGKVAPKATPCDTPVVGKELKCSSTSAGGQLLERHAVAGCTGASDTCSSAQAYLAWGQWKLKKQCTKSQVCAVSGSTGTCVASQTCDPKTACCGSDGNPLTKGLTCGGVAKTEYRCAASGSGVERRTAKGTCTGTTATCSTASLKWTGWSSHQVCKSGTACTVGDDGSPGCTSAPGVDCTKSDKWEGTPTTSASKLIGGYADSSTSLILSPKVHLKGATDKDYLTYTISDSSPLYEPRAHVEWSAAGAVMVCAYYKCLKSADGKSCAKVACPAGTVSYSNSAVSGVSGNGCCATLSKGTIDFAVDAPGTADESGQVYFNVLNKAPFCQEVSVKLVFGKKNVTQCDPKAACCTSVGKFQTKGTKCGTAPVSTEYKCSSLNAGGNVLVRKSYGGCTGTSASCSNSAPVWSSWSTQKDCGANELCVVADKTKSGSCVVSNEALCKATDKWEGPSKTAESISLGSFTENSKAVMVDPMVHLGLSDVDYFKYRIVDDPNTIDPVVDLSWTAASAVTVCAYYQCLAGPNGKDCYPVTCPKGSSHYVNSAVSGVAPNGCCMTGKTGKLSWEPDAPGFLNTDETGWVYFNVKNAAPICQRANIKISFMGSKTVCGDGKCDAGEASSCGEDCGSCSGKCGDKYDSNKVCQCDPLCASAGDCCWDKPLVCGG
ncbi:MAG: hypothetical protein KC502_12010 [Myxococcales bacterium]|nr:hypothetical protein [Myxococcales bacterium]